MCITSLDAHLHSTLIGVWDIKHPKYGYRHVLAYQNAPENKADGSNCMLLHIQSTDEILPEYILDTSDCPDFLKNAIEEVQKKQHEDAVAAGWRGSRGAIKGRPRNFVTEMGIYHIAILNDVKNYKAVLHQIPVEKRPAIDPKFFKFFYSKFKNYPLLLCCFNNKEAAKASPIMVHYKPKNKDIMMVNLLESHGDLPELVEEYWAHQTLFYSSYLLKEENEDIKSISWQNVNEPLKPFLPDFGGIEVFANTPIPNLDLLISTKDLHEGNDGAEADFGLLPMFKGFDGESDLEIYKRKPSFIKRIIDSFSSWN